MSAEILPEVPEALFTIWFAEVHTEIYAQLSGHQQQILNQGLIPAEAYHREHPDMTGDEIIRQLDQFIPGFADTYRVYAERSDGLLQERYGITPETRIIPEDIRG